MSEDPQRRHGLQVHAAQMLRISPWLCGGAALLAAALGLRNSAPMGYALGSAAFGALWFGLLALSWRTRHAGWHFLVLMLCIFGHQWLRSHWRDAAFEALI